MGTLIRKQVEFVRDTETVQLYVANNIGCGCLFRCLELSLLVRLLLLANIFLHLLDLSLHGEHFSFELGDATSLLLSLLLPHGDTFLFLLGHDQLVTHDALLLELFGADQGDDLPIVTSDEYILGSRSGDIANIEASDRAFKLDLKAESREGTRLSVVVNLDPTVISRHNEVRHQLVTAVLLEPSFSLEVANLHQRDGRTVASLHLDGLEVPEHPTLAPHQLNYSDAAVFKAEAQHRTLPAFGQLIRERNGIAASVEPMIVEHCVATVRQHSYLAICAGQHRVQEILTLNFSHNEIVDLVFTSVVILIDDVQPSGTFVAAERILTRRPDVTTFDEELSDVLCVRCVMPHKLFALPADAPDRLSDCEEDAEFLRRSH